MIERFVANGPGTNAAPPVPVYGWVGRVSRVTIDAAGRVTRDPPPDDGGPGEDDPDVPVVVVAR